MNTILDWQYLNRILPDYQECLSGNDDLDKVVKWIPERSFCDEVIPIELREQRRIRNGGYYGINT